MTIIILLAELFKMNKNPFLNSFKNLISKISNKFFKKWKLVARKEILSVWKVF